MKEWMDTSVGAGLPAVMLCWLFVFDDLVMDPWLIIS
jgi:hypothetical protein